MANLKQSIVIVNEYTSKNKQTGKGSRGSSPGKFVVDYMARKDATETLAPVEVRDSGLILYTTRYMARESATEQMKLKGVNGSISQLKDEFAALEYLSGRGFGRKGISLSGKELMETSKLIQNAFDEGHSVQKIVLSFTQEYLKETGIIEPSFEFAGKGSYKGKLDQLKLRHAIGMGLNKMTRMGGYESPEWVGVIQVDTNHIHCHLALTDTDFSKYRLLDDGTDRGKLNEREKYSLRTEINHDLMDLKAMRSFHHQIDLDRHNVVSFVKDYAYDEINHNTNIQLLIASLPKNKRLWRYNTNNKEMTRSNELSTAIVFRIFKEQPNRSGYADALKSIRKYASERQSIDKLSFSESKKLIDNGKELIMTRSVNGLYSMLKDKVVDGRLTVRTPMIDVQSSSDDELKSMLYTKKTTKEDSFDQAGFELRVRGFSSRRKEHLVKSEDYKQAIDQFDDVFDAGQVNIEAVIMRRFFEEELIYNMKLVDKYRYFFKYDTKQDKKAIEKMYPTYELLNDDFNKIMKKESLLSDYYSGELSSKINIPENINENVDYVNDQIKNIYDVPMGVRVFDSSLRTVISSELKKEENEYVKSLRDYTFESFRRGVATSREWEAIVNSHRDVDISDYYSSLSYRNTNVVAPFQPKSSIEGIDSNLFNSVKALDIHHLGLDFYGKIDTSISDDNIQQFVSAYTWRDSFMKEAEAYLEQSDQPKDVIQSVKLDLIDMNEASNIAQSEKEIKVVIPNVDIVSSNRMVKTIRIDDSLDVISEVQNSIVSLNIESEINNRQKYENDEQFD